MNKLQKTSEAPFAWIGIDVSKETFTAAAKLPLEERTITPENEVFKNDRSGARSLFKWLQTLEKEQGLPFGVAMEATGKYSMKLYENLMTTCLGLHVAICNPLKVSHYMRACDSNKTDKADAGFIARFAAHFRPDSYQKASEDEQRLKRLARERAFLVDSCTGYKNYLETLGGSSEQKRIKHLIDVVKEQIHEIDEEMNSYVADQASNECKEEIQLMQTMPGVGKLSAAIIYGELGSLKNYTRKQLSAMSGVCPLTLQSGTSLHKGGLSKKGSRWLRRILFLDSQQAILRSPAMATFHKRMITKENSSKMSARVACMRKLLLILRGMVVSGKAFDPNHVSTKPIFPAKKQENSIASA